ncbi:response regulator transcription factor [Micrococcales bacterium 31B]|nr:response regulator transcription factor [Micrococcales bacterium 31B]
MKTLLLVEDDARLGPLLCEVLGERWEVTLMTSCAAAGEAVRSRVFDVIVTDRRLPDGDGADLIARLRRARIATPVLMLTALGTVTDRVFGLDAGANDYLVKPFEIDELEARLRALTRTLGGREIDLGSWVFDPEAHTVATPYTGRIALTPTESALLELLARNPETTFSRRQILSAVFERDDLESTVDTYVYYLRRKTERDLIATVRGQGYRLGDPA